MSVGSVDGNLDAQTGDGSVRLGKVVGEEVRDSVRSLAAAWLGVGVGWGLGSP